MLVFRPSASSPQQNTAPSSEVDTTLKPSSAHRQAQILLDPFCYYTVVAMSLSTHFLTPTFTFYPLLCLPPLLLAPIFFKVDCMSPVCGLLPFAIKDHPDQWYRLFLSLFIHAGCVIYVLCNCMVSMICCYVDNIAIFTSMPLTLFTSHMTCCIINLLW